MLGPFVTRKCSPTVVSPWGHLLCLMRRIVPDTTQNVTVSSRRKPKIIAQLVRLPQQPQPQDWNQNNQKCYNIPVVGYLGLTRMLFAQVTEACCKLNI